VAKLIDIDLVKNGGKLIPPGVQHPDAAQVPGPRPGTPPGDPQRAAPENPPDQHTHPHAHKPDPRCPMCNWSVNIDPATPDPEDPAAFRDAVFNGFLFEKTYTLFGGALQITFRDATTRHREIMQRVLFRELAVASSKPQSSPEHYMDVPGRRDELALAMCTVTIKQGTRTYTAPDESTVTEDTLPGAYVALRQWIGADAIYQAAMITYSKFFRTMCALAARALDPSFYTATGSSGGQPASPSVK
jgi:hypothetical protein